jgi:hypothetical protein
MTRSAYEFFAGLEGNGNPIWATNIAARQPVFCDAQNGVGQVTSVSYNPGIKRYLRNCCLCQFSFCAGTSQEAVGSPSHGQPEKCRGAETKSMRPHMDRLMEMTFERNR